MHEQYGKNTYGVIYIYIYYDMVIYGCICIHVYIYITIYNSIHHVSSLSVYDTYI